MRAHAYGGLGFRVRVSESSLYSLFIPPEPSLLWRDDRLFLSSVYRCGYVVTIVVMVCCGHRSGCREADGVADAPL